MRIVFVSKQPDLFKRPATGVELRDEVLDRFKNEERSWIERARKRMIDHAMVQSALAGYPVEVCSDDVWDLCPPPVDRHPSIMGPVFHGGMWIRTGYRASKRPSAHARVISVYTLKE